MPSTPPRLALSLPPDVYAAVFDLADAVGKPASKVVTGLLQEMLPELQGMAKFARASRSGNKAAAKRALKQVFGDALAHQLQQQAELFKQAKGSKP